MPTLERIEVQVASSKMAVGDGAQANSGTVANCVYGSVRPLPMRTDSSGMCLCGIGASAEAAAIATFWLWMYAANCGA